MKTLHSLVQTVVFTALASSTLAPAIAACLPVSGKTSAVQSPATRTALLELYTSEGCDSCPPADRWLATIHKKYSPAQAIPLSLHLDYWDYIGWKDRFATPQFGARHSALVSAAGKKTVYTPQVFNAGKEISAWRSEAQVDADVSTINRQTAAVQLKLEQTQFKSQKLNVQFDAKVLTFTPNSQAYLALVEDALVSKVTRGENAGATLHHTSVVRVWQGPFALEAAGLKLNAQLDVPSDANTAKLRVVGFVQAPKHGEILQALALDVCI